MKMLQAMAALLVLGACATSAAAQTEVRIESGGLRGVIEDGIVVHRNIPFAAPPVGDLRWRPPAPAPAWQGMRDASAYGPTCPQPERNSGVGGGRAERQSEDCLQLNVWAPQGARDLPVMVWIHGGGHRIGSGAFSLYDGAELARQGVVLVTINYRIGLLGYFAHPALTQEAAPDAPLGNYGFMDQIAALEWVQRNIHSFGGDPRRVTVFGESAGAASTLYLLASPHTRGLFQQAIVQSGGGLQRPTTLAAQEQSGVDAASRIGIAADARAEDLRAASADQWIEALGALEGLGFGPFIDGRLITEPPWRAFADDRAHDVPLMIGANDNEASVMGTLGVSPSVLGVLGPRLSELRTWYGEIAEEEFQRQALGDALFVAPAAWVAAQTADGAPSFFYNFTYVAARRRGIAPGASHGSEIPYIFRTWQRLPIPPGFITDEDRAFSALISSCWVSFARDGAPTCGDAAWPAYASDGDQIMLFGPQTRVTPQPRRQAINLLLNTLTERPQ